MQLTAKRIPWAEKFHVSCDKRSHVVNAATVVVTVVAAAALVEVVLKALMIESEVS